MKGLRLAAIGLALAVPMAGWEASVTASDASVSVQPRPAALAYARVVSSEAIILNEANDETVAIPLAELGIRSELADIEKERPGVTRAVARALVAVINRSGRERLPELQRREALIYQRHFNDAELETLTGFALSPVGQRSIAATQENARTAATAAALRQGSSNARTMRAMQRDGAMTLSAARARLPSEDRAAIEAFERSALGRRLGRLEGQVGRLVTAWYAEDAPWENAARQAAVADTIAAYRIKGSR